MPAPVQIVFGVHDEADPAIGWCGRCRRKYPHRDTAIVADTALYGANAKVSNLINMLPAARHDTLVLSDSDIAVGPHWLAQVTGALARPGVGIVTCLYTGEPARDGHRLWSSLAAMGTSYDFLPNAVLGTIAGPGRALLRLHHRAAAARPWTRSAALPLSPISWPTITRWAAPCAPRAIPWRFPPWAWAIPPPRTAPRELFRHELRWTRTIRMVNPAGPSGQHRHPWLRLCADGRGVAGFQSLSAWRMLALALARAPVPEMPDRRAFSAPMPGPLWLMPVRDLLSFAVFVASLFGETVHWRGSRFAVEPSGAMSQV